MTKKKVEKNVIQFMHPSNLVSHPKIFKGESRWFKNFDNKEILLWNYSAHNRKPMIAEGEYLCKKSVKSKELIKAQLAPTLCSHRECQRKIFMERNCKGGQRSIFHRC